MSQHDDRRGMRIDVFHAPSMGRDAMIAHIGWQIEKQIKDEARRATRAENRLRKVLRGDAAIDRKMKMAAMRKKVRK